MGNKKTTTELIKEFKDELKELNKVKIKALEAKQKRARKKEKIDQYTSEIQKIAGDMSDLSDKKIDYYIEQFRSNIPASGNLEKMSQEIHMIRQLLEVRWLRTREWTKVGRDVDKEYFRNMLEKYRINENGANPETEIIECLIFANRMAHYYEGIDDDSKKFFYSIKSEMVQTLLGRRAEFEKKGVKLYQSVDTKNGQNVLVVLQKGYPLESVHLVNSDLRMPTYKKYFSGLKKYEDILRTPLIISPFLHSNNIEQIIAYKSRNSDIPTFMPFLHEVEENKFLDYLKKKADQEFFDYVLLNSLSVMKKMDIDTIEKIFEQIKEKIPGKKGEINSRNGKSVNGYKVMCSDFLRVLEEVLSQQKQSQFSMARRPQSAKVPMEDIKTVATKGMEQKSRAEASYGRTGLDRFNKRYGSKSNMPRSDK